MKISKSNIVIFIVVTGIILFQIIVLEPFIKKTYQFYEISKFTDTSWKYSLIIFIAVFILLVGILFFVRKREYKKIKFFELAYLFFIIFLMCFIFFKRLTDYTLLYFNQKNIKSEYQKTFNIVENSIRKNDHNSIYLFNGEQGIISDVYILKHINNQRVKNNLKPIFELKNKDTIELKFCKGYFDVEFLKRN